MKKPNLRQQAYLGNNSGSKISEKRELKTWPQPKTFLDWKCLMSNSTKMNVCNMCGIFGRNDAKAETPVLWPPLAKSWLIGNDFDVGGIGGRRRRGRLRMRWLDGITDSMAVSLNSRSWRWTGRPGVLRFMGSQRVGHDWATELKVSLYFSFFGFFLSAMTLHSQI